MDLEKEFKKVSDSLYVLRSEIIVPYITNCFQSLQNFVEEKLKISVRFHYQCPEKILQGLYKIGIENCQKEYDYYNFILKFKEQFEIDYQIMKQTTQNYYNIYCLCNSAIFKDNDSDVKEFLKKEIEFYINKYKFYNSFKINLS